PFAVLQTDEVVECGGKVVAGQRRYAIPADDVAVSQLSSGKASWFDIRHGGAIDIWLLATPAAQLDASNPAERWRALPGRETAVIAPAAFDELGHSTLIIWDKGLLLRIEGTNIKTGDLIAVAEGLL